MGFYVELQEPVVVMIREKIKCKHHKIESINAPHRDGQARSSDEISVIGVERRGLATLLDSICQPIFGRSN